MDNQIVWQLLLQLLLILLNAVFACAEIAVISMNDNKLAKMAEAGDRRALRLARLTSQPARFLATIQVAITLSGFLGSAFAADNFSDQLVSWLLSLGVGIPMATLDTVSVIVITLILSYFTLVFGELVPKRLAMRKAETLALAMSSLVYFISKLFAPIVWLLTASTNGMLRLLGVDPNAQDEEVTEEEIRMLVDVGSEKGAIDREEKELIQNVFAFDDLSVGEIATHRTEICLLWQEESAEDWGQTIQNSRYSHYPLCGDSIDDVLGILNAKAYFRLTDRSRQAILEQAVEPVWFVPESVKADVLFRNMKKRRCYFAVILDEYGGMQGIVTVSDLVEQLVGRMEEADSPEREAMIEQIDCHTWKILGAAPLEEVAAALAVALPSKEYDTFGGLIFGALGYIPEDGSSINLSVAGLQIKVLQIAEHRVGATIVSLAEGGPGNPPPLT